MDKYTLLTVLNVPFVTFGYLRAFLMFHEGKLGRWGLGTRLLFWSLILFGLLFAEKIYNSLAQNNLTDSSPLSIPDVVLVTGVIFCMFLCMRLYTKVDNLERRLSDLHEKLSIILDQKSELRNKEYSSKQKKKSQ